MLHRYTVRVITGDGTMRFEHFGFNKKVAEYYYEQIRVYLGLHRAWLAGASSVVLESRSLFGDPYPIMEHVEEPADKVVAEELADENAIVGESGTIPWSDVTFWLPTSELPASVPTGIIPPDES